MPSQPTPNRLITLNFDNDAAADDDDDDDEEEEEEEERSDRID